MFDRFLQRDSLGAPGTGREKQVGMLADWIWAQLMPRFVIAEGIEATPAEVEDLLRATDGNDAEGADADAREFARQMVLLWKVNRALYRRYGGVVIFQQLDPLEPIGAYRAFLKEMEQRRILEIYDAGLRAGVWDRFSTDQPFEIPPAMVDFETPWWLQRPPGEAGSAPGAQAASPTLPAEGYTIVGETVRFVFDPSRFESATDGVSGEWARLNTIKIFSVYLAGDFNNWSPSAWLMRPAGPTGSVYLLERGFAELGGSGSHAFKFVINRNWWVEPPRTAPNQAGTNLTNRSSNFELVIP